MSITNTAIAANTSAPADSSRSILFASKDGSRPLVGSPRLYSNDCYLGRIQLEIARPVSDANSIPESNCYPFVELR